MGTDNKGLILVVTYDSDARLAFHPLDIVLKFTSKLCIGNIVYKSDKTVLIQCHQPPSSCSQMGVVVRTVKQAWNTIIF